MSCNGCRVLHKGCTEDCTLRQSLQWIKSAASQSNATLFLARFYGRAGLFNLINAGPTHLRAATFRSLLYEACGRIINPVYGSAGLICSGNWQRCQEAVDTVLRGGPLEMRSTAAGDSHASWAAAPQDCDILHRSGVSLRRSRTRKRSKSRFEQPEIDLNPEIEPELRFTITGWSGEQGYEHRYAAPVGSEGAPSQDSFSVETEEPSLMNRVESTDRSLGWMSEPCEVGLELTLGKGAATPAGRW